jgi:hypothetical protein
MKVSGIRYRIVLLALLSLGLAACGGAQPQATVQPQATATAQPQAALLGKWQVVSMAQNGEVVPPPSSGDAFIMEFAKDGSLTISQPGSGQAAQKSTYTLTGDGQLTLNIDDLTTIEGRAEIDGDQFVLAYDQPQARSRLRQVNAEGTPIDAEGTPVAEDPPVMDHIVMTFERVR